MKQQSFILDSEGRFKSRLLLDFNDKNYDVKKSQYKYCSIDFIVLNLDNLKSIYIEHKDKKINAKNFQSFMINKCKLDACKRYYKDTIFVWDCLDNVYWCYYSDELHQSRLEQINNSDVYFIDKNVVNCGFDNLIYSINEFLG